MFGTLAPAIDSSNLVESLDIWRETCKHNVCTAANNYKPVAVSMLMVPILWLGGKNTAVNTEHFAVDQCRKRKVVKNVSTVLPCIWIA